MVLLLSSLVATAKSRSISSSGPTFPRDLFDLLTTMLSKTPRRLFFQGHVSLRLPLRLAPQALLTSPLLAIVIPLRPSAQQPPFPSDSILELTPPARSTVSRGPSGSPSSAAPGAHPDTPLTLGCRCPPNSPQPQVALTSAVQVGLAGPTSESASEPPSESGALGASPECSASRSGGGARGGEPEWRRGR